MKGTLPYSGTEYELHERLSWDAHMNIQKVFLKYQTMEGDAEVFSSADAAAPKMRAKTAFSGDLLMEYNNALLLNIVKKIDNKEPTLEMVGKMDYEDVNALVQECTKVLEMTKKKS